MLTSLHLRLAAFTSLTLSSLLGSFLPAQAAVFGQRAVDPSRLIAIASPYGQGSHQLLIVEQISNSRPCWQEKSTSPTGLTTVDPLLLNFNFSGICGRSIDSNGYSIRMADQDMGLKYSLRIVQRNNELVLVGFSNQNRSTPEIEIGRTHGVTRGFAKIDLDPGWRMTRRVYNGRTLGHIYLSSDQSLPSAIATAPKPQSTSVLPATISPPTVANPTRNSLKPLAVPSLPPETSAVPVNTVPVNTVPVNTVPTRTAPTLNPTGAIAIPVPPPESAIVTRPASQPSDLTGGSLKPLPPLTPQSTGNTRLPGDNVVLPTVVVYQ